MKNSTTYFFLRRLKIKTFSWEYWPMWLVYLPVSLYYLYLAAKARSFFFFSAANPSIETGGMFFESKQKIFELIPQKYFPKTLFLNESIEMEEILNKMNRAEVSFPVIAKPDRGERGWCVQKINNPKELIEYRNTNKIDFLIQQYIDYPMEFSVFYYRNPNEAKGTITSLTYKKLLTIIGDGKSTNEELIRKNDRAFLQFHKLKSNPKINFKEVLLTNEEKVLVPYGNHVLGAEFKNYNHIIDQQLTSVFDNISKSINGFYYGRFDLRTTSIEDLKEGKNISILELNGAGAEPAHIYDPQFSFFTAQKVLAAHYKMMFDAAKANKQKGDVFMTYASFKETRNLEKAYKLKTVMA
jgi:hypothetical protein